jgi:hypothetical protein
VLTVKLNFGRTFSLDDLLLYHYLIGFRFVGKRTRSDKIMHFLVTILGKLDSC